MGCGAPVPGPPDRAWAGRRRGVGKRRNAAAPALGRHLAHHRVGARQGPGGGVQVGPRVVFRIFC